MKLKQPIWHRNEQGNISTYILGFTCGIQLNNDKFDAVVSCPGYRRPEIQTGFLTEQDAQDWVIKFLTYEVLDCLEFERGESFPIWGKQTEHLNGFPSSSSIMPTLNSPIDQLIRKEY